MRIAFLPVIVLGLLALARADEKPADAGPRKAEKSPTYQVPFRLTEVKHILVRARINGKGPYNFIMDTGAPALFVSTAVAKSLGVESDKMGWGTFDRFEIEGGVVIDKAQGKIADPFQLDGINRMGLAGVELHGVIGYNLLARYKIELDFTRDRMGWSRLNFDPGLPEGLEGKAPGSLDAMAGLAKLMSLLIGKRASREIKPRGFLGIELADKDNAAVIAAVLKDSPAAAAGLLPGDRLTRYQDQEIKTQADLARLSAGLSPGDSVRLTIVRGQETRQVAVQAGKGL